MRGGIFSLLRGVSRSVRQASPIGIVLAALSVAITPARLPKWLFNFLKTWVPAYPGWDQPTQNLGSRFPNAKNYVCLAFLIMSLQATAQIQNGEITGVIADPSGAVVADHPSRIEP